ncbi:MAG: DPP IV N-terminal domain-containing protein [Flavobacteriales bacterium]
MMLKQKLKISLLAVISLSIIPTEAQTLEKLSLEESVTQQWRKFYPQSVRQFSWHKANNFSVVDQNQLLRVVENDTTSYDPSALGVDGLKYIPRLHWNSANVARFSYKGKYYTHNFSDSTSSSYDLGEDKADLNFSGNHKYVAYSTGNNFGLFDISANKHIPIATSTEDGISYGKVVHRNEFGVHQGSFWSPNSKYIAYYKNDERTVAQYPIVHTNSRIAEAEMIRYPMAGSKSEEVTLEVYNVSTKQTTKIKTEGDKEQYLTNIAFSPDERSIYIAVLNRDQNHVKLNQYDVESGNFIKTLFEEKHDKFVQPLNAMIFIPKRDHEFLWRSKRNGYDHFYRYDINGNMIKQVTDGAFDVKDFIGFDKTNLLFTAYQNHGMEVQLLKSSIFKGKVSLLTKQPGVHNVKVSELGQIFDTYSNVSTPYVAQLLDRKGKVKRNILTAPNPYKNVEIAQTKLSTIKAEDGTILNTRMIVPANFDESKKYPALVYVYNGPGVQLIQDAWLANASLWMHYLANQGYVVYTVDGRGSAHRGRDFENATFRNLGFVEMEDQIKGVDFLKSQNFINPERIAVHGWSYGGFMTTGLLLNYPGTFTCGVAGGPVMDWSLYEVMYTERSMDNPETNPEGFKKNNWIEQTEKLQDPLLLIHGTGDDVVVWQHSLEFVRKCVENGVEVDYFAYPEHKHNVRGKDRVHLINKVLKYIIRNNK